VFFFRLQTFPFYNHAVCSHDASPERRVMPRPSWSGFLKLSLVSVPVKAYTATDSSGEGHLNLLRADWNGAPPRGLLA
jgi:hypothetical protein